MSRACDALGRAIVDQRMREYVCILCKEAVYNILPRVVIFFGRMLLPRMRTTNSKYPIVFLSVPARSPLPLGEHVAGVAGRRPLYSLSLFIYSRPWEGR